MSTAVKGQNDNYPTAKIVAPCVFRIDEIEKDLSEVQSSGATEGDVMYRIFSTVLTWMQEKTSPVFAILCEKRISTRIFYVPL